MVNDSFYVLNLATLRSVYAEWSEKLPNVKPYYAVKCNPTPAIVEELARLGSNFDCASRAEIEQVLELGVEPDRVLFANPCKRTDDIVFAKARGVTTSTFDSECELRKMASHFPECKLILRIRADDPNARCPLGNKYGAEERDWDVLMFTARALGLDVIGVSFHVGSYASSPKVFNLALTKAKQAVRLLKKYGFDPKIIDIGGGFSADTGLPKNIRAARGISLIAEPGRFFVERAMELHTPVIGTKGTGVTIDESLYGAFNCILFDHAKPRLKSVNGPTTRCTIFGSTCDGSDIIYKEYDVPSDTDIGSWLVWENMGAYTCAAATRFNGLPFNERSIHVINA